MAKQTEENRTEFLAASKKLDDMLFKQEIYWAQRSRIAWLKHGDKNTKFFHSKASQRWRRNMIHGVRDQQNIWVDEVDDIANMAMDYFENLFSSVMLFDLELPGLFGFAAYSFSDGPILPNLISPTQSAFVPGCLITNNVLVAYETLYSMHCRKKGRKRALALKLDISKAYDHVEWAFLEKMMNKLGFLEAWIERVMSCVSTSSFLVHIIGKAYGNKIPTRGLQ
ncbi:uncharacterized protein LOC142615901 [Castanea sativa]|uniref:uncharacterized protein LOC142615901 n=1 Tax=Castanea sativa TaxID=21020 RepID=UPI003F65448F